MICPTNTLKAKSTLIKQANCCLICKHSYMGYNPRPTPACKLHHCAVQSSDWCKHFTSKFKEDGSIK